jgi:hypothetical protein
LTVLASRATGLALLSWEIENEEARVQRCKRLIQPYGDLRGEQRDSGLNRLSAPLH